MPKILLAGYLGCGNLGDDAVMLGLLHALGEGWDATALAGDPGATTRRYGVRAVERRSGSAVAAAIAECDAVVFPGGSVFQDATSARSVAYYAAIVRKARSLGKPVALVGQGVGPLRTFLGRRLAARAFGMAQAVTVRDAESGRALKEIGVGVPAKIGADSAWLLPPPKGALEAGRFSAGGMASVAIAPRRWTKGKGASEVPLYAEFCRMVFANGAAPTLIEMDPAEDGPLIEAISKESGGRVPQIRRLDGPTALQERLARMDGVVATRLHAGILAATVGVPSLMIAYDPKVAAFARESDAPSPLPSDGLTPERLYEAYNGYMRGMADHRRRLASRQGEMKARAQANAEAVRSLFPRV